MPTKSQHDSPLIWADDIGTAGEPNNHEDRHSDP
jgi:hypothetical protein